MQVTKDTVVSIHYTLSDSEGKVLDSSSGRDPMNYLHGHGNLIKGMEEGLEGKNKGDQFDLKVSPEKGYGAKNPEMVQQVPRSAFGDQVIEKGMQFQTNNGQIVTITEVGMNDVKVDGNHPLAGMELNFKVEVMEVRSATADEVEHGHVHGPDGHHH
jgi:FKBP-type peptidyl-prolyl cis-trans isomerase SlyD